VGEVEDSGGAGSDELVESTVLRQLLLLHPAQVTIEELITDVAADPEEFTERDAIERAVRDLARAGLVHRNGEFAIPSRAALRFSELLEG
jgi:predicted transcriptional regulator